MKITPVLRIIGPHKALTRTKETFDTALVVLALVVATDLVGLAMVVLASGDIKTQERT